MELTSVNGLAWMMTEPSKDPAHDLNVKLNPCLCAMMKYEASGGLPVQARPILINNLPSSISLLY